MPLVIPRTLRDEVAMMQPSDDRLEEEEDGDDDAEDDMALFV